MEVAVFSYTSKYQNLDLRDWNADMAHHRALLKASLLHHVRGLHEDDIVDISAVDRSTRRLASFSNSDTSMPAECEAYITAEYAACLSNIRDNSIHDQRNLIIKRLEVDVTFNIRPQYFNRTDAVTVADVYSAVTSRIDSSANNILVDIQSNSTYFTPAILVSSSFSTYSTLISRSAFPSSSPTSQPTCGTGSYQIGSGCGPCAEGYYTDSLNAFQCTACPIDTYSSMPGSVQCTPCGKFTSNIYEASTDCPHFTLNASAFTYYSLGSFVTILFLSALLFAGENVYIMFMLGLFPFLDIVTDMIYILSVKFWNFTLFVCAIIFFVVPSSMFIYKLVRMRAYPGLIKFYGLNFTNNHYLWLSVSVNGFPLINGKRSSLSYEEHDGIEKLAWYWLLWVLLISLQIVFLVLSVLWQFIALMFLVVWLVVGLFLYQTKMLAIGIVWNTWFFSWTRSNDFDKTINLDASVLNESLFHEFILETVPQIAIQSINNSLIYNGHFPAVSLFSLAMSIFIAINGIYRYGYYLLWKGIKFDEIPLPLAVRMQKINKSMLPRRSVITKKFESLVSSVKVMDSTMSEKVTPSNMRRLSQIMLADNATPTEVVASLKVLVKMGITKLQSLNAVDDAEYELRQLVAFINDQIYKSQLRSSDEGESLEVLEDSRKNFDVDYRVAIDIESVANRSNKVMPYIADVAPPTVVPEIPSKFIQKLNSGGYSNNKIMPYSTEVISPTVVEEAQSKFIQNLNAGNNHSSNKIMPYNTEVVPSTTTVAEIPSKHNPKFSSVVTLDVYDTSYYLNDDFDTFGDEEIRQVEGVGVESRVSHHLDTFDDDLSLECSDNDSDYSI